MAVKSLQVLPGRIELDEVDGRRVRARLEHDLGAVAQQVERLAVRRELVRMGHRLAQRRHGELRLGLGLHLRVDPQDRRDQQLLDQRVLERALVGRHRRLVAVGPAEARAPYFAFGSPQSQPRIGCST